MAKPTQKQKVEILEEVSSGKTLSQVCREMGISRCEIYRERENDEAFRDSYARARKAQAESMVDDLLELAATPCSTADEIQQLRINVDLQKWVTARAHPAMFGDKQAVELSGKDGGPLVIKWQDAATGSAEKPKQ